MTIKKLFFLLIITLHSHANETSLFTNEEENYLREKKEITACYSPKGLPLLGYTNGQNIGILPEIMQLLQKNIPIPIQYIPVQTWEECIGLSQKKQVDIVAMMITSPNHHAHLIPSKKVVDGTIGIATKIEKHFDDNLQKLNMKKIAFLKGQKSITQFVKHKFPAITIVMVDSVEEGLNLVVSGKVYGYADETYSLAYHILNFYGNELKIMNRINKNPISASIGVYKDEIQLLNIINKSIANIDEQKIRNIVHQWIAVRVESGFDYTLIIQISSFLLAILLVSLYWVRRLLKEVKRREEAENNLKHFNENLEDQISFKIQELRDKDVMLLEKTKLAAMGEMMGSIAHQWRRPLSVLHINVEMIVQDYKENKIDQEFVENFKKKNSEIIQYMSQTINDFQNFYKIDKEKILFDVMEKIESVSNLQLNQLEKESITFTKEGESFSTLGYPNEFQQVILNLISNAENAFIGKEIINPYIKIRLFSDGTYGYITISDNAGGIDTDILKKIFDPYFTTKEKDGGMGLGLYISKMIIENNMHGALSISNNNEGVEVLIRLKKEDNE